MQVYYLPSAFEGCAAGILRHQPLAGYFSRPPTAEMEKPLIGKVRYARPGPNAPGELFFAGQSRHHINISRIQKSH